MNLSKAIQLVFSRRKRIEYNAWEEYVSESLVIHAEEVMDLTDSVEHSRHEDLNADWAKFNDGGDCS
jgi:hypothetical protein